MSAGAPGDGGPAGGAGPGLGVGPTVGVGLRRMRVELGYDGTGFHGWAAQPGLRTVQGEIETALATVCGQEIRTVVGGRTDAGVHARRQVIHLDITDPIATRLIGRSDRSAAVALRDRLRGALRHQGAADIVIHSATEASTDFDARFAAVSRSYSYRIADRAAFLDPLRCSHTTVVKDTLDADRMHAAAQEILGLHDFLPFCRPRPDSTTIRTLLACSAARDEDGIIVVRIAADAFCHHMVRALVGGLLKVGTGSWPVTRPAELIARAESGSTDLGPMFVTPAHGLVLEQIVYPPAEQWAERAAQTRARRDSADAAQTRARGDADPAGQE